MPYETLASAFQAGDILYGLDAPRDAAIQALRDRGIERRIRYTVLCCIPAGQRAVVVIQNDITNSVWDPMSPRRYTSVWNIGATLHDGRRGREFRGFLSGHERYDVAGSFRGEGPRPLDPAIPGVFTEAWKRTSKAGLEFQIRHRGRAVHFIIAGIDLGDVARKQGHGTSITSSELRWLHRHRNVRDVQAHVRFWLPDREVTHAEVFARPEWNDYDPTHDYQDDWTQVELRAALQQGVT